MKSRVDLTASDTRQARRRTPAGVGVPSRPKSGITPAGPGGPSYPPLEVGGAGIDAAATIARQLRWMAAALMTHW
jgi:hypothetical protein